MTVEEDVRVYMYVTAKGVWIDACVRENPLHVTWGCTLREKTLRILYRSYVAQKAPFNTDGNVYSQLSKVFSISEEYLFLGLRRVAW
jgi:hypothetical protein